LRDTPARAPARAGHLTPNGFPLVDADPAVLTLVWPDGGATLLVAELAGLARQMSERGP